MPKGSTVAQWLSLLPHCARGPGSIPTSVPFLFIHCSHQVLRFRINSQEQLAMVKSLAELDYLKLDFWKEPVSISLPIELRVPRKHVRTVKSFLESNGIIYSVMIKNLQSLVDEQH
eukprot:g39158.t1